MNAPRHDHDTDEREWAAQERGRRQASAAAAATTSPGASGDGGGFGREIHPAVASSSKPGAMEAASYRRIAEALRRPPSVELSPDFAARVARIAQRAPASVPQSSQPAPLPQPGMFERALVGVLASAFALCAVGAALAYGARVSTQLQAAMGVQGVQWMALLAGCLALSWSFDWLRRRAGHGDNGRRLA